MELDDGARLNFLDVCFGSEADGTALNLPHPPDTARALPCCSAGTERGCPVRRYLGASYEAVAGRERRAWYRKVQRGLWSWKTRSATDRR